MILKKDAFNGIIINRIKKKKTRLERIGYLTPRLLPSLLTITGYFIVVIYLAIDQNLLIDGYFILVNFITLPIIFYFIVDGFIGLVVISVVAHIFTHPTENPNQTNKIQLKELAITHPDGFGGYGVIGEIAVETALAASIFTLFLPWLLSVTGLTEVGGIWGLFSTYAPLTLFTIIILVILFTYIFPSIAIHKMARAKKDQILTNLSISYDQDFKKYQDIHENKKTGDEFKKGLWIQTIITRYEAAENVKTFPFSLGIFSKLIVSLLIPIITGIITHFITLFL
jgi:hypothetical protein